MGRRKAAAVANEADDADTGRGKKARKSNFTDADVRLLLTKYSEKKEVLQNEDNSAIVIKSQVAE